MKKKSKKIAFLGLCTAISLVFSYVEAILPPLYPAIPGIKIGLANIVVIFLLYRYGNTSSVIVQMLRIILANLLFGNITSFWYSLAGGLLSVIVMIALRKLNIFSKVGVSVAGAVTHNIGQILTAMILLETSELGYYLAVLSVTGIIAGVFVGLAGSILINRIPKNIY